MAEAEEEVAKSECRGELPWLPLQNVGAQEVRFCSGPIFQPLALPPMSHTTYRRSCKSYLAIFSFGMETIHVLSTMPIILKSHIR